MSDLTVNYLPTRAAAGRGGRSRFGLLAMILLALASVASGLANPAAIATEYQIYM